MKNLEIKNLSFSYGARQIFQSINLTVHKPEIIGLVAPNGTGKSTFINLLDGTLSGYSGQILLDGEEMNSPTGRKRRKQIVKMPDQADLFDELTGKDHLELFLSVYPESEYEIEEVVQTLRMSDYIGQKVSSYSLGMRQRLAFGMVLITDASVYLLDEVMNSLDPSNVDMISHVLNDLVKKQKMIFLVSHLLDNLENLSDRILFLQDSQIKLEYSPEKLHHQLIEWRITEPEGLENVVNYLEEANMIYCRSGQLFRTDISELSEREVREYLAKLLEMSDWLHYIRFGRKTCQAYYQEIYEAGDR